VTRVVIGVVLAVIVITVGGCVVANRFHVPAERAIANVKGVSSRSGDGRTLSIVTWNIGYAGMGRESDFKLDGGEQVRPLSKEIVERNLNAITNALKKIDADVILLQEVARPSFSTYQIDVLEEVVAALPGMEYAFGADILTRWVPPPIRTVIGNAIFSRRPVAQAETRGLPLEKTFQYGLFRAGYRMHILYLAGPVEWVIVNIHFSAFDPDDDGVREEQLEKTLAFANSQYAEGRYVIIGGDWNLKLAPTEFPHQTDARDLFWVRDLDVTRIPSGWTVAADMDRPTARTANTPYVDGINYRLIIDGFLLSPNVDLVSIRTQDLGFTHADHNPVQVDVLAK